MARPTGVEKIVGDLWASGMDADKQSAYETLYYVLVQTLKLLAPAAPIVAAKIRLLLTSSLAFVSVAGASR